jgi:hypothetical protein
MLTTRWPNKCSTSLSFQPELSIDALRRLRGSGVLVERQRTCFKSTLWATRSEQYCWARRSLSNHKLSLAPFFRRIALAGRYHLLLQLVYGTCVNLRAIPCSNSLRFGTVGDLLRLPYVQVACSSRNECAIFWTSGTLRVFDTRLTDPTRQMNFVFLFFVPACGCWVLYMPSSSDDTCWVAWGLESKTSDAVVKVWKTCDDTETVPVGDDWLWTVLPDKPSSKPFGYRLAGSVRHRTLRCSCLSLSS